MDQGVLEIKKESHNPITDDSDDIIGLTKAIKLEPDISVQPNSDGVGTEDDWQIKTEEVDISDYEFPNESDSGDGLEVTAPVLESFYCSSCSSSFPSKKCLAQHETSGCYIGLCVPCVVVITRIDAKAINCGENKGLYDKRVSHKRHSLKANLKGHLQLRAGSTLQCCKCQVCNKRLASKGSLTKHMLTHTKIKPFECEICQRRFAAKYNLKVHIATHKDFMRHKCNICQKEVASKRRLATHKLIHTGVKPFKCDICQKRFLLKQSVKDHLLLHSSVKSLSGKFNCEICNKELANKQSLKAHKFLHTGKKPFACEVCQKQFPVKYKLKIHLATHRPSLNLISEKPFACKICKNRFTRKAALTVHLRLHSGSQGHKCNICQKEVTSKSSLQHHMLTHSGEKRFECAICQRRFALKSNLKSHMNVHSA